jgi:hypothetical protein
MIFILYSRNFSYAEAPNCYKKIMGVTGTLESLHQESRNIMNKYIHAQSIAPSMYGKSKLKFS